MTIDAFVAAEAMRPFAWGRTDCASTADRWVHHRLGFSPMARFGRKHRGEIEGRIWLAETPLPVAVNRVMRSAGLSKTTEPRKGDVGLIRHAGKLCVAIHTGQFWFSRDEIGLIGAPFDTVWKAWRIA